MSGPTPIRNPKTDSLITPDNAVLALIDYQPDQYAGVKSINTKSLLAGVITLGEIATAYGLPVVLSTVGVQSRGMQGTNGELKAALPGAGDRPHHPQFLGGSRLPRRGAGDRPPQTDRRRPVDRDLRGLSELSALDALKEGYEVYVVADAIGGVSTAAHEAAMQRIVQAGAVPISVIGLAGELQRDWGRAAPTICGRRCAATSSRMR